MANKTLGELIKWLEAQPADKVVEDGFADPHSDRGYYCDVAFNPAVSTRIGDMLLHAKSALGATFLGYKGGDYTMNEYTEVLIGRYGDCGESITDTHFKHWSRS